MLFNSYTFVIFFAVVYFSYLLLQKNFRLQNFLLLIVSWIFYGWWDWRFLGLLILTSVVDFVLAQRIEDAPNVRKKKFYLTLSVLLNLSVLGFFKYFNFFSHNLIPFGRVFGLKMDWFTLHIVLPVGISFYIFQEMSYIIDVYRGELRAVRSFRDLALFVAFFPQLVAGPIERSKNLIPQIISPRTIQREQVDAGIFLILWGYYKKIVIADNLGILANQIFDHYYDYQGLALWVGTLAFCFQIYGDFSGYSDIGRGLAKLMGFDLMINFKLPYLAQNPSDFWSRWHISFSTWLRDYLYIPLGGNRNGKFNTYRNLMLTMLLGGLWHGAAWNFVLWGSYHGILLVGYHAWKTSRPVLKIEKSDSKFLAGIKILGMFILINMGWIIFRSHSLSQIIYILTHLLTFDPLLTSSLRMAYELAFFTLPLLALYLLQARSQNLLVLIHWPRWRLAMVYSFLLIGILVYGVRESMEFIYFRF